MIKQSIRTLAFFLAATTLTACATGNTNAAASAVNGEWTFSMSSPFGAVNAEVTMSADGGTLSGSFDMGDGRLWPIENGVVNGNDISFRVDRDGSPMVYEMRATIDGDSATGVAEAMGTEVPWTLTRKN